MTRERAHEIVGAINDRCFVTMGFKQLIEIRSLEKITLAEMIEAKSVVEAENDSAQYVDGTKAISMTPDDRLIAAAYCLEHYEMSKEAIIIGSTNGRERFEFETEIKALAIVPIKHEDEEDED